MALLLDFHVAAKGQSSALQYLLAFYHPSQAFEWALVLQAALLEVTWPDALLQHVKAFAAHKDREGRVVFRGPR